MDNATRQDQQKTTGPAWLPGDPDATARVRRTIRVDHAGEYGAVRIYRGQIDMLGHTASGAAIRHMAQQEAHHLRTFEGILARRRVRPTALAPLWHAAGYALGAATALMGDKAAMACTVAVEEVIDGHYARQHAALGPEEAELGAVIAEFRDDELAHRDAALGHGAEGALGYLLLSRAITAGSRLAIWLSERF